MKPRRTLVDHALHLHRLIEPLREAAPQAEYCNADLRRALGRTLTPAEGACLRAMGWRRAMRFRKGRFYRAWLPPLSIDT